MVPIFIPQLNKIMNCLCFASGSGTNIRALKEQEDGYCIQAIVVDRECGALVLAKSWRIPFLIIHPSSSGEVIWALLEKFLANYSIRIDLVILAGYMRIIKNPILSLFSDRILNIHPANLSILGEDGERLLTGKFGVLKALLSQQHSVCSSVHFVVEGVDMGELLLKSIPLLIEESLPLNILSKVKEYRSFYLDRFIEGLSSVDRECCFSLSKKIQERQKKECDWPALTQVVKWISEGRYARSCDGLLLFEGKVLEECGVLMDEVKLKQQKRTLDER